MNTSTTVIVHLHPLDGPHQVTLTNRSGPLAHLHLDEYSRTCVTIADPEVAEALAAACHEAAALLRGEVAAA